VREGLLHFIRHKESRCWQDHYVTQQIDSVAAWFERYQGEGIVGQGSFGWVVRSVRKNDGATVAIKVAKPFPLIDLRSQTVVAGKMLTSALRWASGAILRSRLDPSWILQAQAEKLAKWAQPAVVKYEESGTVNGLTYLCMEFLEGETLRSSLQFGRPRIETLIEVVDGLVNLPPGEIHGDLKPENIIVTDTGAKMIDPGHRSDDPAEVAVTTTAYYPDLDRSDLPACGAMLWEIVLGCHPFIMKIRKPGRIGPRLARLAEDFGPPFRVRRLANVRRPWTMVPTISPELEEFLLRAIGLELTKNGSIEIREATDEGGGMALGATFSSIAEVRAELARHSAELKELQHEREYWSDQKDLRRIERPINLRT
jgi:serine/threonine protein kinase